MHGIIRRHRFSFRIRKVGSEEKEKAFVLQVTSDLNAPLSGWAERKQLSAGRSRCQSLMPSLTHDYRNLLRPGSLWQKAILQIICLSSRRLEAREAGLHMSPEPVQAGSSHRSEESADTWEQSPRRLSPLRASLTAQDSSLRIVRQPKQVKYSAHVFFFFSYFFCGKKKKVYILIWDFLGHSSGN